MEPEEAEGEELFGYFTYNEGGYEGEYEGEYTDGDADEKGMK